jgi:hypothetical protein
MRLKMHKDLTKSQHKALKIIKNHGPIRPREFAKLMWPDSDCWSNRTNCGPKGVTKGGGMNLAGGGYLGKLRKKDWVRKKEYWPIWSDGYVDQGYVLTILGEHMLKEAENVEDTATC